MMEKIKQFFAGIASVTIVLYAIGYIIHFAHGKMLGISMVDPVPQDYLISGGTFFLSTCFALYATVIPYWYLYLFFFLAASAFWYYDQHQQKKNQPHTIYFLLVAGIISFYLIFLVPLFRQPLRFQDFLLRQFEPISGCDFFTGVAAELRTWIVNENLMNKIKLEGFYISLLLATAFITLATYCIVRQWQKKPNPQATQKARSWLTSIPQIFPVYILFLGIITTTLIVFIPMHYGVLIKPYIYPEVKLTTVTGVDLMPNQNLKMDSRLWLLRENSAELMLYVIYIEKGKSQPVNKIMILKKTKVQTIEILAKSFIFEISNGTIGRDDPGPLYFPPSPNQQ